MNDASPSGNLMDGLGLAVARRTVLVRLHCAKCKVWGRGDVGVGLFFRSWAWPLSSSKRNSECFSIPRDLRQFHVPNFVEKVCKRPLSVPTWLCPSAQSKVHKDMDEQVWCGRSWLACTESWPQPDRTPLGWIRPETGSQAFSSDISVCKGWVDVILNLWIKNEMSLSFICV